MTVVDMTAKAGQQAGEYMQQARKSAKAGTLADILPGAVVLFGSPKETVDAYLKGEDLIEEGQALVHAHKAGAGHWITLAALARDNGVSARGWVAAVGGNTNTLGRLARAHDIMEAAKANKTPVSLREAIRRSNSLGASEVTAMIVAYGEAEEGTDPTAEGVESVATRREAATPTVESYVKRLDTLAEALSGLLSGDYATPKAETLEALKRQQETLARMAKQHETLIANVGKAGRSPKGKAAKAS